MQGEERAEYGSELIKNLSKKLTQSYGKGFDYSSLYKFVRFYKEFRKAGECLNELQDIGLILKRKGGNGYPSRIYVKNFMLEGAEAVQRLEKQTSRGLKIQLQEVLKINL